MAVTWAAGFVLPSGAELLMKILLLSAERWLSGGGHLGVGVRLSYLSYLDANNNQVGGKKICLGFEPRAYESKASCPLQSLDD